MANYVRFDWMIKRLLRNKADTVVLEGFLSVLLERQITITTILESEGNQDYEDQKYNRVDLLVEDDNKAKYIIEVQNDHEIDFFQRMVFGASKVIAQYTKMGEAYGKITKVYSINIVYFGLGQGKGYVYKGTTKFVNIFDKNDELQLTPKQKQEVTTAKKVPQFTQKAEQTQLNPVLEYMSKERNNICAARGITKEENAAIWTAQIDAMRKHGMIPDKKLSQYTMAEAEQMVGYMYTHFDQTGTVLKNVDGKAS